MSGLEIGARAVRAAACLMALVVAGCGGGGNSDPSTNQNKIPLPTTRSGVDGGSFVPSGSAGCQADASEPNDSTGAGAPLQIEEPRVLNFCDDAVDFFVLPTTPGETYFVETSALELRADTVLQVLRTDGSIVAENDDNAGSLSSRVTFTAEAGMTQVTVLVRPFDSSGGIGVDTGYVLTARNRSQLSLPDFEFNGFTLSGFAGTRSFEFVAYIDNLGDAFAAPTVAFYLSRDDVFTRGQDEFFAETAGDQIEPGGRGEIRGQLTVPVSAVGEYYIFLVLDDQGFVAELDESNNADRLTAPSSFAADSFANCHDDSLEQDDEPASGSFILAGDDVAARHCGDGSDWFYLDATANAVYDLSTTALGGRADTVLEVFDFNGNLVATNDDSGGLESHLTVSVTEAQFLDVRVGSYADAVGELRNYVLHLRENDARADLVASVIGGDNVMTSGTTVNLTLRISNTGRTDAGPSSADFGLFCDQLNQIEPEYRFNQLLASVEVGAVAAGEAVDVSAQLALPIEASGDCYFVAIADSADQVPEAVGDSDESDAGIYYNYGSLLQRFVTPGAKAHGIMASPTAARAAHRSLGASTTHAGASQR